MQTYCHIQKDGMSEESLLWEEHLVKQEVEIHRASLHAWSRTEGGQS